MASLDAVAGPRPLRRPSAPVGMHTGGNYPPFMPAFTCRPAAESQRRFRKAQIPTHRLRSCLLQHPQSKLDPGRVTPSTLSSSSVDEPRQDAGTDHVTEKSPPSHRQRRAVRSIRCSTRVPAASTRASPPHIPPPPRRSPHCAIGHLSKFHGAHGAQRLAARRSRKRGGAARALRRAIPRDPMRCAARRDISGRMDNFSLGPHLYFHCLRSSDIIYRTLSPDSDSSTVYRHPHGLVARSETCDPLSYGLTRPFVR
ncbi:hypothetical protein PsYK624_171120 [Phanerochaete sordida]|uniref:Uncharacterized protein n=1 Tax=Phanerochaete sordida TaxID=48140 RepID=A0A9P3LMX5_9APHY|nr:hypothetical protein PsYK624_171120 [Phanerochaete sordida]